MVRQVLSFAGGLEGEPEEIQPAQMIRELQCIITDTMPRTIVTEFEVDEPIPPVRGDPTRIQQVLLNLCVNARDAMPDGGRLRISVRGMALDRAFLAGHMGCAEGYYAVFEVRDNGVGIAEEDLPHICEPFFTSKRDGMGSGLGLPTVKSIVRSHGGFIDVSSEKGVGTTFRVFLPSMEHSQTMSKASIRDCWSRNNEGILLVDDESSVLAMTRQTLEACGYKVLTATDGAEAVAVFVSHPGEVQLVVTDILMPVMDGVALAEALRRISPETRIVALSGGRAESRERKLQSLNVSAVLRKPFTSAMLLEAVYHALAPEE